MSQVESALTKFFDIKEEAVTPQTKFVSKKNKHLYEWWCRVNGGQIPSRRMFDVVDHKMIIPNLFLTEVLPDGDFVFRLFGETVIQLVGRNRKGELVQKGEVGEYGHALYEYYHSVVAGRVCRLCLGSLAFAGRDLRKFESIDCPLTGDGGKITFIVGVMDFVD
ncbi:MAG TPA: PAS domain-containing protein [Dongiaceae bacterium]|jgi:hypothetical protein